MKNLIFLNRSGMGPDGTSRKGRYSLDPILSRLCLASLICLCMLTVGVGQMWAGISVLSFTSSSATPNNGTSYNDDQSNSWTINHDSEYKVIDSDAIHVGSSSKTASYLKATSSAFSGVTVTSVVVQAKQNGSGTVDVKINNSAFGGSAQTLTNSYDDYTFTGSVAVTGNIVANLSRASATKKNFFLKTLTVTYLTAITLDKNGGSANGSVKYDHDASSYATSSFTAVTRDGYTCTGYWTASSGGTKILNANGTLAGASITVNTVPYTSSSTKWAYAGKTLTLYAQWEAAASCTTSPSVSAGSLKGSVSSSSSATAQCTGGITNIGGAGCSLTSYGFAVGTSSNPTIGGTLTGTGKTYEVGSSIAASTGFEKLIDGLSASTTYYVRPYATNGYDTGYGTQFSFTTLAACTAAPTVTAGSKGTITSTTAAVTCASGLSSLGTGGCAISSYGFVYGTSANPTTSNSTTEVGTSIAASTSFNTTLTGLTEGTLYYVRPYATNGYGTGYGPQVSFGTPKITVSQSSRAFGDRAVGGSYEMTFTVEGVYLQSNISIAKSGTNQAMFSIDNATVTQTDGTATTTTITVTYSPSTAGSHSATLTLSSTNATNKTVSLSGTGKWTVTFLNGNGGTHSTSLVANSTAPSKPGSNPAACDATSTTFIGWTQSAWSGKQNQSFIDGRTAANVKVYTSSDNLPAMTSDMTYYPVYAKGTETSTPVANTWTRITSTSQLTDGATVLLVQYYSDYAINTTPGATSCTANAEITNSTANLRWTAVQSSSKWKFKSSSNHYLSTADLTNGTAISLDGTYDEWTISADAGGYSNCFNLNNGNDLEYYSSVFKVYAWSAKYASAYPFYIYIQKTTTTTTYSDYLTTCCTELGTIGGVVTFNSPIEAKVTWNKISNVSSWTLKYKVHGAGAWSTAYTSKTSSDSEITESGDNLYSTIDVSCNTAYDFLIIANPASGYCDKEEELNNSGSGYNSGSWTVTSTIVNGSKTSVPATACGDYTATFAATSGYHFPAKGDITVTGASDFSWNSSTGVLSIDGGDISDNISISLTCPPDACSDWGFYYGTDKVADWAYECFTKVKPADATDHEWQTDEIALPNKPNWYIDNATEDDGKKKVATWDELYFAMSQGDGARPMVGTATGATGKVRIYDNWDWNNRAAGFLPTGYVMKFGSTEYPFTFVASNEYRTEIVDLNSTTYANVVSVGIEDGEGDYVSTGNTQEYRHVFFVPSAAWKTGSAKFCIHYWGAGDSRTDYMSAVPGKSGWYEGWLPAAATGFQFERQNPAGASPSEGNRWTAGENQTLQSNKNCYTMTASGGESDWDGTVTTSLYTSKGKFRMWDNSTSKNWYVTFYPHYVLHFDANSGSGAPADQSVALDASPCQLTVSSTVPTRAGYTFLGWNQSSSATTPDGDWDGGDTHAMTADVTLYAVWAANHTLTYNYNGGDGSSCVGGTKYTGESFTACSSAGDKEGHTFTGWLGSNSVSYTAGSSYSMPNSDLTLTAQWSPNHYDVTLNVNSGTINAGDIDEYTYGVGATLPTDVTRDGYRFDGWFDNVGLTGSKVTTISTTATGDKEYWAKWTAVYTVTWHVGNGTWSVGEHSVTIGNTQVANGEKIDAMPEAPADNTLSSCADKFMGWSEKNAGATAKTTSYYDDLFTDVAGSPYITSDKDFYAVFAEQSNSDGYKYIGDDGTLTDGKKYIFVSSKSAGSAYALKATDLAAPNSGNNGTAVSVTVTSNAEGVLVATVNTALEFEYVSSGTKLKYEVDGPATRYLFINGDGVGMKSDDSRSRYTTDAGLQGWNNKVTTYYDVYYNSTNEKFEKKESADSRVYAFIKQTPTYSNYRTQCDPNIVKVTYNANGGSTTCADGSHDKRNDYTVCSSAPTRDYYTFAGWLCSADSKTYAASATIPAAAIDADFTLTAQWTPVPYSITYELYGGTNSGSNPATYNVTTATITLQDPSKGHDRFEGWYSTYSAGVYSDQVTSIPLGSHGDITLYAKWAERHHIEFFKEGVSVGEIWRADDENMEDAVAGQGTAPGDQTAPTACSSKVFMGWSESEIDDETDDEPADLMKPATGTVDEDKEFHAVWATEESSLGPVTVFNDAFARVDNGTAYGNKGKLTTSYVFGTGTAGEARLSNSSSGAGSIDIDLSDKTLESTLTITFKLKYWTSGETGSVSLTCMDDGATASFGSSPFAYPTTSDWHDCSSTVTGVNNKVKSINFSGTAGKRVYIKDIVITQTSTIYTYSAYSTSCCATNVTLSQNSPEHGTIAFGKTKIGTCDEDKEVSLTITPATGYQLTGWTVATGDGKVAAKTTSPAIALNNNSSAAQNITLTFAEDANGAYDVTASFTLMTVTSWAWTLNSAAIPDPLNLYVGQSARLDVAYTPADVDASKKTYTRNKDNTYINWVGGLQSGYSTISGRTSTGENTTAVTFTHADGPTTTVNVKVLPLPLTHFADLVHGKAFADVAATIVDNALSATKTTPTSDDWVTPNANTCEENHLHLVGWIREDWPALVNYLNGTGDAPSTTAIVGAGNDGAGHAYYIAAGASINVQTFDGVTFYAVWSKVE